MVSSERRLSLVFDLDGTLVNSIPMVLDAFRYALEEFQEVTAEPWEIFQRLAGPADVCLLDLLEDKRNLPGAMARLHEYNRENQHQVVPFEGAVEMLELLRENGVEVALWTGRDRKTADEILTAHDLWGYFRKVVCGDDLKSYKPDPEGLRRILGKLLLRNDEVLLVGDSDVDVLAGHACEVPTMLIRHGRVVPGPVQELCLEWVETPAEAYRIISDRVLTENIGF